MAFGKTRFGVFLVGATALGIALSGCDARIGNHQTTTLTGYDVISGYYASLPQTISFHAQVGTGAARIVNGTVTQMPLYLKTVMGNPTMLYYDNPLTGVGTLRSHANTDVYVITKIQDSLGKFGASTSASATVSGCQFIEEITTSGGFTQAPTTSTVGGYTVRGNLSLDYSANYSLVGEDADCDAMRATFQSCYSNNVGCSTTEGTVFYRPYVEQVFGSLVDAGVITEAEISSTRSLGYHATYQ
jgi:hypothetical protein